MSKVTQVTVRYGRSVQPKPYETKEGLLEAVVIADEGGTVSQEQVGVVMRSLIANVHAALSLEAPVANSTDEPPKKTRKTRAKKGVAKPASNDPTVHPDRDEVKTDAVADEVPVEGDAPGDPQPADEVSDQELQSAAAGAAAKHGAAKVKGLMKEFDVTLLGKLDQETRVKFLDELEKLDA